MLFHMLETFYLSIFYTYFYQSLSFAFIYRKMKLENKLGKLGSSYLLCEYGEQCFFFNCIFRNSAWQGKFQDIFHKNGAIVTEESP